MMIPLSIIVPIYNVEKYIEKCIESILMQDFSDFELILVDDGSPDNCSKICDKYAKLDKRIKVIHQKNKGIVLARKAGVKIANGEYITFVDGDDWIEKETYTQMMKYAFSKVDILMTGYTIDGCDGLKRIHNHIESGIYGEISYNCIFDKKQAQYSKEKILENAIMRDYYYNYGIIPSLWSKLIKKELYDNTTISVDPIVTVGEDDAVIYPLLFNSNFVIVDNSITSYHYRFLEGSMSRTAYDPLYFHRTKLLIDGMYKDLSTHSIAIRQLPYYTLYTLEKELHMIISRDSKKSISEMISITNLGIQGISFPSSSVCNSSEHLITISGCTTVVGPSL